MLHIMIGRARSGKSTEILNIIKKEGYERNQILIVPEQSSYETERRLCECNGNESSRYAEVFSFTNFQKRISSMAGEAEHLVLDDGGRVLTMYTALRKASSSLVAFSPPSQKPEILSALIATIDELKGYCVSPEKLVEIAEYGDGLSAQKIRDLSLIYAAYDHLTNQGSLDPKDQLNRVTELLEENQNVYQFVANKDIYIDGFMHFTPQEYRAIEALIKVSHSVTVSLTCDTVEKSNEADEVFDFTRKTANKLMQLADKHKIQYTIEIMETDEVMHPLLHLERELFLNNPTVYTKSSLDAIHLVEAENRRSEVIYVAETISELVQSGQMRYRDITITARDMTPYRDILENIFARYEIPLFQSRMDSILNKPIFTLITSVLEILSGHFAYEDVFRYLKTGLSNISIEESDMLENYVLLWSIRGNMWSSFSQHPRGYEKDLTQRDEELLSNLNQIRERFMAPFEMFQERFRKSDTNIAQLLYEFMENISLPKKLEERATFLLEKGEPEAAMEYRQLWDIFCGALEQYVAIMGDTPITLDDFSRLMKLLFSQYEVGSIPASLDRVIAGDMPRLLNRKMSALFMLGVQESEVPQVMPAPGLFNQEDRDFLLDNDIELSHYPEEKMKQEFMILYEACTQPTEKLYMSYPLVADAECEPSFLFRAVRKIFPESNQNTQLSLKYDPVSLKMKSYENDILRDRMEKDDSLSMLAMRFRHVKNWERGNLSHDVLNNLYGTTLTASPSSLEKYRSCQFAFFMQYGLHAKERKGAGFRAPEYGTFVHYVLEYVLQKGKDMGDIKTLPLDVLRDLSKEAIESYIKDYLGGLEWQTPRFRYLFLRLESTVFDVVKNVLDEIQHSKFDPLFFEISFGEGKELPLISKQSGEMTLLLKGTIDRVDAWENEGKTYLKVVDYKTGGKEFRLSDVWNGIGLQMLLYLFALVEKSDELGISDAVPAGVLYLPAKQIILSGDRTMSKEARQKEIDKELKRKGILLDEKDIIEAMEMIDENDFRFLPIKFTKKTQTISGDGLVSAEHIQKLKVRIDEILSEFCVGLQSGIVKANPVWNNENKNSCMYCPYKTACHFEETLRNEHIIWMKEQSNKEFWLHLEESERSKVGDFDEND